MIYEFSDLRLDTGRRQLSRAGQPIKLPNLSYKVLEALLLAHPNLLTHDQLIDQVWGANRVISPENLSQRITLLRQSLGDPSQDAKYIEPVFGQGFRLIPGVTSLSEDDSPRTTEPEPKPGSTGQKKWAVAALLLIALGAGLWSFFGAERTTSSAQKLTSDVPLKVAVLPFVNISQDPSQEYFVDGLTEEVINSLVTIDGLLITGRTSSFAYKNQNTDLREIGDALGVDYLLEGSVRKDGTAIRVTAQLIDVETGTHLVSRTYDHALVDIFALQTEISEQVAAELKISLVHADDQYSSAVRRLDAVALEKLFSARAQVATYSAVPVKEAITMLAALDAQYPETPEIMGLMARAEMVRGSSGEVAAGFEFDYGELARQTLRLDAANLDALYVLAHTEDDFATTRIGARQYYQAMLQHYPGRADNYGSMFSYLTITYTPCTEMLDFLQSIPAGVMSTETIAGYRARFEACAAEPWISRFTDAQYERWGEVVRSNPNQRVLADMYLLQLALGAWVSADATDALLNYDNGSWWASLAAVHKMLHNRPTTKSVQPFVDYLVQINYGSYDRMALPLVYQGGFAEDYSAAAEYLASIPKFPIEVANQHSVVGLMLLQHRTGDIAASKQTANEFLQAVNTYRDVHPGSYHYHNLGKNHLIAAFYAEDFEQARQVLETGFAPDHAHWLDDKALMRIYLAPWIDHPVAEEYLERIEQDRARARAKFEVM